MARVFPYVSPAESHRVYWSNINVAVSLLFATAGGFLVTLITSSDAKLRSGRHYMAWSLVCFAATLLINLNQQIYIVSAHVGSGLLKEKRAEDIEEDNEYLRDHLTTLFTKRWCPQIHKLQMQQQQQQHQAQEPVLVRGAKFAWMQIIALAQAVGFIIFALGIAFFGVTMIKIGLVVEGAVIIAFAVVAVEECVPAIFVHFIRLPEEEEDSPDAVLQEENAHAQNVALLDSPRTPG